MRWLLQKDLRILRRSPLLSGMLIVYPIAVALMIGFALSSPPGKPKVAFYSEVTPGQGRIDVGGGQRIDISSYSRQLFGSIDPVPATSREDAIAKVRSGAALAALIVPQDLPAQVRSLITSGVGSPTVELVLNTRDPLERQYVNQAIDSRVSQVEQGVSQQVLRVAVADLQQVLNGGTVNLLGQSIPLLGLRNSRTVVQGTIAALPARSPLRAALGQVATFADLAIQGLGFAKPVLGSIGSPLTVLRTQLSGRTTPSDSYAAAIAVVVSLMFVTVFLAAGMLALEREENTWSRLVRGLVTPGRLLLAKGVLAAGCGAAITLIMSVGVSLFVPLDWARLELWILALAVAAAAFGALGVAIGALCRETRTASLAAFLLALPIAFVALVPRDAVSEALGTVLDAVAFIFPFRPALQAVSNAFTGVAPGMALPLLHLIVLTAAFGAVARVAVRRFMA